MFYQKFIEQLSDNTSTADPKIELEYLLQNVFQKVRLLSISLKNFIPFKELCNFILYFLKEMLCSIICKRESRVEVI